MLRHIVLFRWVAGTTDRQIDAVMEALRELPAKIPEIASYEMGPDAGINAGNADFGLVVEFADREAYMRYRDHPAHRAIIDELITPLIAARLAVQYAV